MTGTDPAADAQPFATVMRGYHRTQVDGFVAGNAARLAQLETELADAQRLRLRAVRRAEELEQEVRDARRGGRPESDGFGVRAEKIIRLAEQEAAEVRSDASRDAAAMLEKVRTGAEAHRHDIEQALIARETQFEEQAAERTANLEEQEQRAADHVAAAREEAARIRTDAARAADRTRLEAEVAAAEILENADVELTRRQHRTEQEVERLCGVRADVRADLTRLAGVLRSELGDEQDG
ncbi:MAG: hypothetical protein J0I49_22785 [Pseudonocardia sp.]|uniref:hypothetical protein n=1 Tax=Pseudonocardia sp. TaxID=60912 RepID=UPI001ACC7A77|nr:hypothetical protein [Pseudonocardia sp.]MBN9100911.1 hypothetical protein [Pseudonocardia sp.]